MPRSLLSIYPRQTDRFDEMLTADGEVRERFSFDNGYALNRLQRQLQRYGKTRPEISDALAWGSDFGGKLRRPPRRTADGF